MEKIHHSPNYRQGSFQNIETTEVMLKSASIIGMIRNFINKPTSVVPSVVLPSKKTDLKLSQPGGPVITWFGHSSYCIRYKNFTILIDPVFSSHASPVTLFGKAFRGANVYGADDIDRVDLLILTHDHYDHLDYHTITRLFPKTTHICTALGVGAHLEYWGIPSEKITELDWWDSIQINEDLHLTATPARHFSGRTVKRNQTLWCSFILSWGNYRIFIGGDSGYDGTFKKIGEHSGPFDLAILECGQYGKDWPFIHMLPEETVQAAIDLKAKVLMPVHWGKFSLSLHEWNEPVKRVVKAAKEKGVVITTPEIGEPVIIGQQLPAETWWDL